MDNLLILERLDRIDRLISFHTEVLTFEEACGYTRISRSYLYKLTASSDIPHSKPNRKLICFERAKLNTWLRRNEPKGKFEIDGEALDFTFKHRKK